MIKRSGENLIFVDGVNDSTEVINQPERRIAK
jgi:hypothetical protein